MQLTDAFVRLLPLQLLSQQEGEGGGGWVGKEEEEEGLLPSPHYNL